MKNQSSNLTLESLKEKVNVIIKTIEVRYFKKKKFKNQPRMVVYTQYAMIIIGADSH
jgi:hypothetical protein